MTDHIAIIDYGSGNLRSAAKAFERVIGEEGLDLSVTVTDRPEDIRMAARIVLPGQGAFGSCMRGLSAIDGMREALGEAVCVKGQPFLGICVGMQLLATRGLEHGEHAGLGWIPGEVVPINPPDPSLKIPHMGWNTLTIPEHAQGHPLTASVGPDDHFYFVHSFMFESKEKQDILACTHYGHPVSAIAGRDNIAGVQFHPEKSQKAGLRMIRDFLYWDPA
ncbi:MAG: imidazole glycerol phosphate synthase subunit HisH [Alphaproteobacteria bacterium]|nr:imidazole glycerol phosphate synthase subunit HisH [Alphaproteobacteria bacterium]